jgi:hypothetical protein
MSAGKGDKPRPIDKKIYDDNYDKIKWDENKKEKKEEKKHLKGGRVRYTF